MRLRAEIRLDVDADAAEALDAALAPEVAEPVPRTTVEPIADPDGWGLTVTAEDVAALRAALNSYMRFADTALKVHSMTREP